MTDPRFAPEIPPLTQYRSVIEAVDPYGYEITLVSTTDHTVRKGTWHALTLKGATRKARKLVADFNVREQHLRARRIAASNSLRSGPGEQP